MPQLHKFFEELLPGLIVVFHLALPERIGSILFYDKILRGSLPDWAEEGRRRLRRSRAADCRGHAESGRYPSIRQMAKFNTAAKLTQIG